MTQYRACTFLSGLAFGAAAGLLLAPRDGARTRKLLSESAKDGRHFIKQRSAGISRTMTDAAKRSQKAIKKTKEGIVDALENGWQTLVG